MARPGNGSKNHKKAALSITSVTCDKCPPTAGPFPNKAALATHKRKVHQATFRLVVAPGQTVAVARVVDADAEDGGYFPCPAQACMKRAQNADAMRRHYQKKHDAPSGGTTSFVVGDEGHHPAPLPHLQPPSSYREVFQEANTSFEAGDTSFDPDTTLVDADGGDIEMTGMKDTIITPSRIIFGRFLP
jgi:hypothetical protein